MRLALYAAVLVAGFVGVSLLVFWLAVRPPRLTVPLARRDLRRALDFLATRGVGAVGVFGFSLGGAVALLAAAEDPRIRAVAAYAPFADLRLLGHDLYAWLWLLKYPLVGMTRVWSRVFVGDDITAPAPVEAA